MQICVESFPVEIRGQKKKYFEPMQIFKSLSTGFACFRRNKFWRTVKEIFHQARFYTRWRGMGARLAYVTPLFPYRVHRKRHVSLLAPGRCDRKDTKAKNASSKRGAARLQDYELAFSKSAATPLFQRGNLSKAFHSTHRDSLQEIRTTILLDESVRFRITSAADGGLGLKLHSLPVLARSQREKRVSCME